MTGGPRSGWTATRRTVAAGGALILLVAYGALIGGLALLWSDSADREGGFIWGPSIPGASSGYAVISDDAHLDTSGVQAVVDRVVHNVRLEVTPGDPTDVLFVGVGRSTDVHDYLRGVAHRQVGDLGQGGHAWGWLGPGTTDDRPGGRPAAAPTDVDIWLARSTGIGTRTVEWPLVDGDWTVVVMNADADRGVSVTARTGAAAPALRWIAGGMALAGLVLLSVGGRLVRSSVAGARACSSAPEDSGATGPDGDRPAALAGR
jgi:hypothetical protein